MSGKLEAHEAKEIYDRYHAGGETLEALGEEFGVTMGNVWSIKEGETWAHVTGARECQECACGCGEVGPGEWRRGHYMRGDIRDISGPNNPRWDGGRHISPDGYVRLATGTGRRFEHRMIAERALGKPLPDGAQVHHVNGDPADNRPSNLVVCEDMAYHKLIEMRTRALEACGNADWRKCYYCGEHDDPSTMGSRPTGGNVRSYHHRKCNAAYTRKWAQQQKEAS